jgi:hypothetical protein
MATCAVSVFTLSSPILLWISINQYQMFIVLTFVGVYIPEFVLEFIYGMSFTVFSFDFVPVWKAPVLQHIYDYFEKDQKFLELEEIGAQSGSAIVNHFNLIAGYFLLVVFHVIFYASCRKYIHNDSDTRWSKSVKALHRRLTFGTYIRFIMESVLFLSLS